jgi:WD40 repeat protein
MEGSVFLKGHTSDIDSCEFGSSPSSAVTCSSEDQTVRLWDVEKQSCTQCFVKVPATHAVVREEGRVLYVGTSEGRVLKLDSRIEGNRMVSPAGGKACVWETQVGNEVINQVDVEAGLVFSCDDDGAVFCQKEKDGVALTQKFGMRSKHNGLCTGLSVRRGKRELVSVGTDCSLKQWSFEGKLLKSFTVSLEDTSESLQLCNPPQLLSVSCDAKGRIAAGAAGDGRILIWDLEKKKSVRFLNGHSYSVSNVCFGRDYLLSVGNDKKMLLWKLDSRKPKSAEKDPVKSVELDYKPNFARMNEQGWVMLAKDKQVEMLKML